MSSALETPFDIEQLRGLAGDKVFERGANCFLEERVRIVERVASRVRAQVQGTSRYEIRLRVRKGLLSHECTCPAADDGSLCKHGVAVGLGWLAELGLGVTAHAKDRGSRLKLTDLREPLDRMKHRELVALVLDHAVNDERLERRLIAAVAARDPKGPGTAELRRQIDRAVVVHDFVEWRASGAYADGVRDCVEMLEDLSKRGRAADVVELVEHTLQRVESALGSMDDSDGHMQPILEDLERLHLAACRKAKPDPAALAKRLFEWELGGQWDTFLGAAKRYAGVLSARGLAEYRRLAEKEWAKLRPLAPGDSDERRYTDRFRITHIMKTLAEASGDLGAWIAVAERDLASAWSFLRIAEKCRELGEHDLALEWAERGARTFEKDTDSRLLDFLASEYARRRRYSDAVTVRRRNFEQRASPETYRALEKAANSAHCWPEERARAMAWLHRDAKRGDGSALVRVLLAEKELDAAWAQVKRGHCPEPLAFEVAQRREKAFPQDALPLYLARIERIIALRNNDGYRSAVELLLRVRALYDQLGNDPEFPRLLSKLRGDHGAKRNLMRFMDEALTRAERRTRTPARR